MSRTRSCVDHDPALCEKACPDGGDLDVDRGACICKYKPIDEICDDNCKKEKPEISIQRNSTSKALYIITKSTDDGVEKAEELNDDYGIYDYDHEKHHTEIVRINSLAITGLIVTSISQSPFEPVQNTPVVRVRRAVTNTTNTNTTSSSNTVPQEIPNPFICIEIGSAILFRIEVNKVNRSLSHYPRYNKDHLFNRNDKFDYGNFRLLHSLIQDTNKSLSTFTNVFTEAGVFVFYDNAESSREMIVKVTAQGEDCSENSNNEMLPASGITLTKYGVAKSEVSAIILSLIIFSIGDYGSN